MAIVNELTWTITANGLVTGDVTRVYGSADLTNGWKGAWLAIILRMITDGWIVEGSSDGVTGVMDQMNRWSVIGDLRGADISGGPAVHSWIVLRQHSSGMYILLSHGHRSSGTLPAQFMVLSVSSSAYVGGDASNDPTSPDEAIIKDGTAFLSNRWISDAGTANLRWHVWSSSTNRNTRIAIYVGGTLKSLWMFEELKDSPAGWATPWLLGIAADTSGNSDIYTNFWTDAETIWRTYHAGTAVRARFSTMCIDFNGAGLGAFVLTDVLTAGHTISSEFALFDYKIWVNEGGHWGRMGQIYDLWNESNASAGAGYPATPGDQTKLGDHWVFPGDGSTTFLTS